MRKIVALAATVDYRGQHTVFAAADDGTFWQYDVHHPDESDRAWTQLPMLPQLLHPSDNKERT